MKSFLAHRSYRGYVICLVGLMILLGLSKYRHRLLLARLSKPSALQISVDLRQDKYVNLGDVAYQLSHWLESDEGKKAFFSDRGFLMTDPSAPAQERDISLVIDALIVQSQLAATRGDEERAWQTLHIALDATEKVVNLHPSRAKPWMYARLYVAVGASLHEMDIKLSQYPLRAQQWHWFSPTQKAVRAARKNIRPIGNRIIQLIKVSPSNEAKWKRLAAQTKPQLLSQLSLVRKALDSK